MTEPRTAMLLEDAAVVYDTGERDALLKGTHVYLAATPDPAGLLREALEQAEDRAKNHNDLATAYNIMADAIRRALAADDPRTRP